MAEPLAYEPRWTNAPDTTALLYDELLVLRMFEPWSDLLLDQLKVGSGEHVLDIATGTGIVSRNASERAGRAGRVVGCDISPAMLARAKSKSPVINGAPIEYRECSADAIDVEGTFDVITCQQGLQFFSNREKALQEMQSKLKENGRMGIAAWCSLSECPPFEALAQGVEEVIGKQEADSYRGGPWGFPKKEDSEALFSKVGLNANVTTHKLPLIFEKGFRQLAEVLTTSIISEAVQALDTQTHERLLEAAAKSLGLETPDEKIVSFTTSHVTVATR